MGIKDLIKEQKNINLRFILISILLITQMGIYVIFWTQMIANHKLRTGMDFLAMYTGGKIAQIDGISQVYDVERQQAIQTSVIGFELPPEKVLLYQHLPFTIPILQVVVTTNYTASFIRWTIFLLSIAALSSLILVRSLTWKSGPAWLSFAAAITFFPLFESLLHGQDSVIALLGLAICFYGLNLKKDSLAGIGLALVTIRPHIALVLVIPFIFQRRRVFIGFLVGASSLALISLLLLGVNGIYGFVEFLLYNVGGDWYGMNEHAMFNFLGILVRFLPEHISFVRITAWIGYAFSIIVLSFWWVRSRDISITHFGIATIVSIIAVPHLHFHDLTLLLVPIFSLMFMLESQFYWQQQNTALLPLIYSVTLLFGIIPTLWYIIPYLVMFSLFLWLWKPESIHELANRSRKMLKSL